MGYPVAGNALKHYCIYHMTLCIKFVSKTRTLAFTEDKKHL